MNKTNLNFKKNILELCNKSYQTRIAYVALNTLICLFITSIATSACGATLNAPYLAASASSSKVILTWTSSNKGKGALAYNVLRSNFSGTGYTKIASSITNENYTDLTVVNGATYYYVVNAQNSRTTSANSNEVVAKPIEVSTIAVPTAPETLIATVVENNQVELRWKASTGTGPLIYSIFRSSISGSGYTTLNDNVSSLTYIDNTVIKGTKYYYIVKAKNSGGMSPASNEASLFVSTAKMLFKTNFGAGVNLSSPSGIISSQAWQYITGTDASTGYTFPVSAIGSDSTKIQLIGPYGSGGTALNTDNVSTFFGNSIRSTTGPKGNTVNELSLILKIKEELPGYAHSQIPFLISRPWNIPDTGDVYLSYWHKFPADLASKLFENVSSGNWRMLFEWKTGGWKDTYKGDYRMKTVVLKGTDGLLYWSNSWDNNANITSTDLPGWTLKTYWSEANKVVPVPLGRWFKFEVFWHRSAGTDGRYWVAVDGKVIADHYGPNIGDFGLPITRLMVTNVYTGGYGPTLGPVEGSLTDLHIWNGFPCGNGIPCP